MGLTPVDARDTSPPLYKWSFVGFIENECDKSL